MKREWQIGLLTHLYAVYIALNLQFNLGEAAYNVVPTLLILLLLYVWVRNSHIKLNINERLAIWFLIYFNIFVTVYYEICIFIGKRKGGFDWIKNHNHYILYFIIFMLLFYSINGTKRWR